MIDSDTTARALVATFEDYCASSYSCAGIDPDNPPDELPHMDSNESENYGAAVTWDEAAKSLRTAFALGDGGAGSPDVLRLALLALDALAELEGAGSDLHDAASGCAAMLRSMGGEPASPNDLLYVAGLAVDQACEQSAAAMSAIITVPDPHTGPDSHVRVIDLGHRLRDTGNSGAIR